MTRARELLQEASRADPEAPTRPGLRAQAVLWLLRARARGAISAASEAESLWERLEVPELRVLGRLLLARSRDRTPPRLLAQTRARLLEAGDGAHRRSLQEALASDPSLVAWLARRVAAGASRLVPVLAEVLDSRTPDAPEVIRLLTEATAQGDDACRIRLARRHLTGHGVPLDPSRGRDLIQDAATSGSAQGLREFELLRLRGGPVPRNREPWSILAAPRLPGDSPELERLRRTRAPFPDHGAIVEVLGEVRGPDPGQPTGPGGSQPAIPRPAGGARIELAAQAQGRLHPLEPGEGGAQRLLSLMGWDGSTPPRHGSHPALVQVVRRLSDPAFRSLADPLVARIPGPRVRILLHPEDEPEGLVPGQVLLVPWSVGSLPGGFAYTDHVVASGEDLAGIAAGYGLPVERLVEANRERLRVGPWADQAWDGTDWVAEISIGAGGCRRTGVTTEGFLDFTLLHEFGHAADGSWLHPLDYGPDGQHFHDEILTLSAAFREGLASFLAFTASPEALVQSGFPALGSDRVLRHEASAGGYTPLAPEDLGPFDFLANEAVVAAVLLRVSRLAGGVARLEAALRATDRIHGRTLPEVLAEVVRTDPASRDELLTVLAEETRSPGRRFTPAELAPCLESELPDPIRRWARRS